MSDQALKLGEFCWAELMTPNTQQAKSFYCDLFDWQAVEHKFDQITYTCFKKGEKDLSVGMIQTPEDKSIPPHWMGYISVENVDSMVKKAAELGAKIKVPATPVSDFGRFAVLEDPTGACFGIWQYLKSC